MKIHRSPRWLELYYYQALIDGKCVAKNISVNKIDLSITGGSPKITYPIHTRNENYISLQSFINSLQEGIGYEPDKDCEWVHDFWA